MPDMSATPTLKAYAIELLIVIFGITVAFQIEKLDDNRRESAAHATLRQGLMSEIRLNLSELDDVRRHGQTSFEHTSAVFQLLMEGDRSTEAELETALANLVQLTLPEVQSSQLDAYLESDLTATSTARPALIELRARLAELEDVGSYRTSYLLEHFLPLLSPEYDFTRATIVDPDGVWSFRMRNAVALLASLEQSHLETERAALCALIRARAALITAGAEPDGAAVDFDAGVCSEER